MFLSPGVTPWKTSLPGVVNGANNPGIRIFEYDKQTLLLKVSHGDFLSYYCKGCASSKNAANAFILFCCFVFLNHRML